MHFKPLFDENEECHVEKVDPHEYGVDASFPIHYNFLGDQPSISETLKYFGGRKIDLYREYMSGCQTMYAPTNKAHMCAQNEEQRMSLNLNQPRQMANYTDVGFEKMRVSDQLWNSIRAFWDLTLENGIEALEEEYWPEANTYTNHW